LDIAHQRLYNQQIAGATFKAPGEVVGWLGAVQAQDYLGSLWAVGLRVRGATEASIEQAIADRTIVRTWPMRGTLHFVAAADARWMPELLTPRVISRSAGRYRQLELDDATFARSKELFIEALEGGRQLSRPAMYQVLEAAGISAAGQRGIHIFGRLAQEGLLCFGTREGKQPTFVLLDEWVPNARSMERDEALAELTRRYFTGHGPATVQDLMWWSGLTATEVKAGLEMVKTELVKETIDGQTYYKSPTAPAAIDNAPSLYLLAPFDEYLLGYKDRSAVLRAEDVQRVNPGSNGVFSPIIVVDGRVVGTWKRAFKKGGVLVTPLPFATLNDAELEAFVVAASRYGDFLGMPVILS
jgi:hypothetical protein